MDLVDSLLGTPPQVEVSVHPDDTNNACPGDSDCGLPESMSFVGVQHGASALPGSGSCISPADLVVQPIEADIADVNLLTEEPLPPSNEPQGFLKPPSPAARPNFSRRPSYDLFECIEQSKHKRLSENNARYVFAQVVEAVYYLETQGITHCDIKDENLVIDAEFKVCTSFRYDSCFLKEFGAYTHILLRMIGQAHRLRQRSRRGPDVSSPLLHPLLWHNSLRLLRDPPQETLPGTACRDLDARRPPLLPAHRTFTVPDRARRH